MTTATMPDRLRQIAILISSVDSAAARQILLQLPTDTARQIRQLTTRLGEVSVDEKRGILAEFQRSAASVDSPSSSGDSAGSRTTNQNNSTHSSHPAHHSSTAAGSPVTFTTGQTAAGGMAGRPGEPTSQWAVSEQTMTNESTTRSAWTRLSTAALVRFVREERASVAAVVISQLAPAAAVEVLQHLPTETRREVLLRLSRLEEVDPEAMQTIDDHLSQRLHEYQHSIQSELENARRIQSLLAAAPPEIRSDWAELLVGTSGEVALDSAESLAADASTRAQHIASPSGADAAQRREQMAAGDEADILPFRPATGGAERADSPRDTTADRLLIQWEFEQILLLPATALAHLLSSTDSPTVLLALAGASPEFMKQFYRRLNRYDAKTLEARLQRIGPIQLRDVDAAQRKIVDNAARLRGVLNAGNHARRAA